MQIRNPAAAGAFYPFSAGLLAKIINNFSSKAKAEPFDCKGIVAPHAGYEYCGKAFASVYNSVGSDFQTIIILGPNHWGHGAGIATMSGLWKTPFGALEIDEEFANELEGKLIFNDPLAHKNEHSIEVQLPWIQQVLAPKKSSRAFKFVPISINSLYFNKESCKKIAEKIFKVSKKLNRKILIIASSDFTHYGCRFGYTPYKGTSSQILKKIKEKDLEVIGYIAKLMPDRMLEICREENLTICGFGPIAAMLYTAKLLGAKSGKLLDYSTSFEVSGDLSAIVAYAGIVIY